MQEFFTTTTLKSLSSLNTTANNSGIKYLQSKGRKKSLSAKFYTQSDGNNKLTIFLYICVTLQLS